MSFFVDDDDDDDDEWLEEDEENNNSKPTVQNFWAQIYESFSSIYLFKGMFSVKRMKNTCYAHSYPWEEELHMASLLCYILTR